MRRKRSDFLHLQNFNVDSGVHIIFFIFAVVDNNIILNFLINSKFFISDDMIYFWLISDENKKNGWCL